MQNSTELGIGGHAGGDMHAQNQPLRRQRNVECAPLPCCPLFAAARHPHRGRPCWAGAATPECHCGRVPEKPMMGALQITMLFNAYSSHYGGKEVAFVY